MSKTAYATPTDDQIAWRDAGPAPDVLPGHLIAYLQGGVGVAVGARSTDGRPVLGIGVACRVSGQKNVRVLLPRECNAQLIAAVEAGSALAATFSRARDHRSIQLKSKGATIREIEPGDIAEAARQTANLADELVELGYTRRQAEAFAFVTETDLVSLEFWPERVFTQTPGPGAGAELLR